MPPVQRVPSTSSYPHLLGDYHVIPDRRQSGRSRGRFITIQHSLSSCRRPAGLLPVGRAAGEGRMKATMHQPVSTDSDEPPNEELIDY